MRRLWTREVVTDSPDTTAQTNYRCFGSLDIDFSISYSVLITVLHIQSNGCHSQTELMEKSESDDWMELSSSLVWDELLLCAQ